MDSTVGILVVVVLFLFLRRSSSGASSSTGTPNTVIRPGYEPSSVNTSLGRLPTAAPGEIYHGSDLGPFKPVTSLPGLGQAYTILRPVNDKVLQPVVAKLNNSAPVKAINSLLGAPPDAGPDGTTTTVNPNGTITKTAPNTWYTRNIGSPVSHAGTAVVHAVGKAFSWL